VVVDESTRADPDRSPQPASAQLATSAAAMTVTLERPKPAPRALYAGFPPDQLCSRP
jgi:hypothetical protein